MPLVVLVEDEPDLASALAARLRAEHLDVEVAVDGPGAVALVERVRPDLVVLDVMLPGFDGLEVCRRIQRDRHVPVLMLTARDDETDLVVGLEVGADDYLTKPCSPRELVARVRALLRRSARAAEAAAAAVATVEAAPADVLRLGDVELEPTTRRVRRGGAEVHLTPTEFELLAFLGTRRGTVMTREQLLFEVWGHRDGWGARTIDSHVRSVRRKLGDDVVRTVHGVGYAARED